jgi:hypothetical protein
LALVLDSMVKLHLLSHTALSQYGVIVDGRITILGAPAAHSANLRELARAIPGAFSCHDYYTIGS